MKKIVHFDSKIGFGYIYIVNNSGKILNTKITFNKMVGIKGIKPNRSSMFKFCVVPR